MTYRSLFTEVRKISGEDGKFATGTGAPMALRIDGQQDGPARVIERTGGATARRPRVAPRARFALVRCPECGRAVRVRWPERWGECRARGELVVNLIAPAVMR
jgi:hypothetical protein